MGILQYNRTPLAENESGQPEVQPGLLRLTSGRFSEDILLRFAEIDFRYEAQLYLRGRHAAIVVREGELLAYIDGIKNTVLEFAALVDGYGYLIQDAAETLRTARSDTVVLTGIWHDVDQDVAPRFEAYAIHVMAASGQVKTHPYRLEMFDWDDPDEGCIGERIFKAASPGELTKLMRTATEVAVRKDVLGPILGEAFPLAGVLWFPERDEYPLVACKSVGMRRFNAEG